MTNIVALLLVVLAACVYADVASNSEKSGSEVGRQKRLLFFDEGGALVKTYPNPYMNQLSENGQNLPYYGKFLNPFFNFIRHFGNNLIAYTIPVSSAIIESIKRDPSIQNTLVVIPKTDPVVAPNPLCEGMRTQVPSPNLCNNFLNCWDGWAFEQECPTGLMFSNNGYCDYADNVDCHGRKIDVEVPQPQPVCSKDFEAFRNQNNCNEFYICVNRQPVLFKCPADLSYSQYLGVCDYAERVDCKSSGSPPSAHPAYPTPQPPSPSNPPSSDFLDTPQETPTNPPAMPPSLPVTPPALPVMPPSAPIMPPQSPTIPPAPAAIPPLPSLLPPGSAFPLPSISPAYPAQRPLPPAFPEQRPLPPAGLFPAPVPKPIENKPPVPYPENIFLNPPGCSSTNIAMSRNDAIRLLQQSISRQILTNTN